MDDHLKVHVRDPPSAWYNLKCILHCRMKSRVVFRHNGLKSKVLTQVSRKVHKKSFQKELSSLVLSSRIKQEPKLLSFVLFIFQYTVLHSCQLTCRSANIHDVYNFERLPQKSVSISMLWTRLNANIITQLSLRELQSERTCKFHCRKQMPKMAHWWNKQPWSSVCCCPRVS